ncbi:hypothetical protein CONCODRAFT_165439 [Conidiobolus coronatus NRRL 28638]|uniref:Uncharacterized protein n=1 Tax=Conidiobolus coronatus (strain ATCC 28846 / CBS 209.66 / NRRL 28638) TaxID=796925 RepID=A0A137P4C3_CONC2|nr:hypothetical protein CONCODRAFT_165439 [Conidiobolus coronatus NRRL 28638]|eukprot:KXN69843.1 hypothetical protein CONCODRAFT_165439 [Conidiobolus coronatus NRRL 28638]
MINKIIKKMNKKPLKTLRKLSSESIVEVPKDDLIDWNFILCLKSVTRYLLIPEKVELSQSNQFLRLILKPILFKSVDSCNYIQLMCLSGKRSKFSGQNIIDYEVGKFEKKFNIIKDYVMELNLDIGFNTYLLLPIAISCPHLTKLDINSLTIPLTTFKIVLSGLKYLEVLSLIDLTLIEWANSDVGDNIDLPYNIKKLATIKCRISLSSISEDPLQLGFNYTISPARTSYVHFLTKKLHKLEEFTFGGYESKYIFKLNRFLSRHPTIRSLSISIDLIDQPLLNLLSGSHELEELTLIGTVQFPIRINTLEFPTFYHLKQFSLRFSNPQFEPIKTKLYKAFPNIGKITMYFSSGFYEFMRKLILRSPLLHTLVLLDETGKALIKNPLPPNNIRKLVLKYFDSRFINLNSFKNCFQLQHVVVYNNEFLKNTQESFTVLKEHYGRFRCWNCFVYKDLINCYRIREVLGSNGQYANTIASTSSSGSNNSTALLLKS